jgi:hypothetical protein
MTVAHGAECEASDFESEICRESREMEDLAQFLSGKLGIKTA